MAKDIEKDVVLDQRKLDAARRVRDAETETETIDRALALSVLGHEIAKGITTLRRSGGVDDVLERRRRP